MLINWTTIMDVIMCFVRSRINSRYFRCINNRIYILQNKILNTGAKDSLFFFYFSCSLLPDDLCWNHWYENISKTQNMWMKEPMIYSATGKGIEFKIIKRFLCFSAQPSCRYNCGTHMGSCSCTRSCEYYGDCCYDYYCRYHAIQSSAHYITVSTKTSHWNQCFFYSFTAHCGYITEAPSTGKILNIKNKPSEIIVHYNDACAMLFTFSGALWRLSFWLRHFHQPKLSQLLLWQQLLCLAAQSCI